MSALTIIAEAFAARKQPESIVESSRPNTNEYTDALAFEGKTWQSVGVEDWMRFPDAIYGFTPEAFCYFLPSILKSGILEQCPHLLVNSSLITMLDRSPDPELWDQFFIDRWTMLTKIECEAVQQWILWLSSTGEFYDDSCTRAFETLDLLIHRQDND